MAKLLWQKGVIETYELDQVTPNEAKTLHPWALTGWGSNIRFAEPLAFEALVGSL
jgi:hypothetical protein